MSQVPIPRLGILLALGLAACADSRDSTAPTDAPDQLSSAITSRTGAVYTLSNAAAGNAVLRFTRRSNGSLEAPLAFPTGGTGTGGGLGNQGALVLGGDGRFLFAVNPGSDEVSVFALSGGQPSLVETVASGGNQPVSLTSHRGLLYVLNAGGTGNIAGFRVGQFGHLTAIPGSDQPLSSPAAGAAQIEFSPDGVFLVVTEKATNSLTIYQVDQSGAAGVPTAHPSNGQTPFGFAFDLSGVLVVSEAFGGAPGQSAVSSYRLAANGSLDVISGSVPTTQTAACWIVITPNGRFGYTTNTGSANVSGFTLAPSGALGLLDTDGITGSSGAGPIDAAIGGRFLYTLNSGAHTISGFAIRTDGSLEPLGETAGLPAGANGLVAW